MNKFNATKKAIEQVFWLKYPQLDADRDYTFDTLFSDLISAVPLDCIADYKDVFFNMMDSGELPLIPVIPIKNGGTSDTVALDFH